MSLIRIKGANSFTVNNSSFWDGLGVGDAFSHAVNRSAGSIDCDQVQDARFFWGFDMQDETVEESGTMTVSVTYHSMLNTTTEFPGCSWTGSSVVVAHSVDTSGGGDARRWRAASSLNQFLAVSTCTPGRFMHIRAAGSASVAGQVSTASNGCFAINIVSSCPGSGSDCP
jgi:hypothetical protein